MLSKANEVFTKGAADTFCSPFFITVNMFWKEYGHRWTINVL